jgi:hypothetical protein
MRALPIFRHFQQLSDNRWILSTFESEKAQKRTFLTAKKNELHFAHL